jgi:Domain of unknown function (DUF222)
MKSWVRGHGRFSAAAAHRLVLNGRVMEHLPALAEAHSTGLISAEHVSVAGQILTPERLDAAASAGVDLTVIDAVLTQVAIEHPHADFVRAVRHYLADLDPDAPSPTPPRDAG